jgi:methylmalonyl-CoA mutase cobalamin-binding subunit
VLARAQQAIGAGSASRLVLATPAGERHELGILMVALCAQEQGVRALYLGCDLPADEIADAALRVRARAVGLGIVSLEATAADREVRALRRRLPRSVELWLGGAGSARLERLPAGTLAFPDLAALETRLVLLREASRLDPA